MQKRSATVKNKEETEIDNVNREQPTWSREVKERVCVLWQSLVEISGTRKR